MPASRLAAAKKLEWGTRLAIQRRGIVARRFHEHASQRFNPILVAELEAAMRKVK